MRPVGAGLGGPAGGRGLVAVGGGSGGDDADADAFNQGAGHAHGRGTGAHVNDPRGTGFCGSTDLSRPVHGGCEHGGGQGVGELGVNTALGGPLVHEGERVGEHGGVEGHVDRQVFAHGGQRAAAALVRVVRGLVLGGGALDGGDQGRQVVGRTRDDVGVGVVTQCDRQRVRGRGQGGDDALEKRVGYASHGHHVGRLTGVRGAGATRDAGSGRTDQTSEREHGSGAGLVPGDPRTSDLHAQHALRVSLKRGGLIGHDV